MKEPVEKKHITIKCLQKWLAIIHNKNIVENFVQNL